MRRRLVAVLVAASLATAGAVALDYTTWAAVAWPASTYFYVSTYWDLDKPASTYHDL
jgi:hypothetical protein